MLYITCSAGSSHPKAQRGQKLFIKERVVALKAKILNFKLLIYLSCKLSVGIVKQPNIKLIKHYDI